MSIRVPCPSCGKLLRAGADAAGKTFKCPGCSGRVIVPLVDAAPADRAAVQTPMAEEALLGNPNLEDVRFRCPHCGSTLEISSCMSALIVTCGECEGRLTAPTPKARPFTGERFTSVTPKKCFAKRPKLVHFKFEDTERSLDMTLKLLQLDAQLKSITGESPLFKRTEAGGVVTTSMPHPQVMNPVVWPPYCVACGDERPARTFEYRRTERTGSVESPGGQLTSTFSIKGLPVCEACGEKAGQHAVKVTSTYAIFANGGYAKEFARANRTKAEEIRPHKSNTSEFWMQVGCLGTMLGALAGVAAGWIAESAVIGVGVGLAAMLAAGAALFLFMRPAAAQPA